MKIAKHRYYAPFIDHPFPFIIITIAITIIQHFRLVNYISILYTWHVIYIYTLLYYYNIYIYMHIIPSIIINPYWSIIFLAWYSCLDKLDTDRSPGWFACPRGHFRRSAARKPQAPFWMAVQIVSFLSIIVSFLIAVELGIIGNWIFMRVMVLTCYLLALLVAARAVSSCCFSARSFDASPSFLIGY